MTTNTKKRDYSRLGAKEKPKIPFYKWVQYGHNASIVKSVYWRNVTLAIRHGDDDILDEKGFYDELEQALSLDPIVEYSHDMLVEWCKKFLFPNPHAVF